MGKQPVWFVTGASRGFGLEIVRQALARGDAVVATARDPRKIPRDGAGTALLPLALDVSDERQAREAVSQAVARFGRIDVLVNNAGRGLLGAVERRPTPTCARSSTPTSSGCSPSRAPCCP